MLLEDEIVTVMRDPASGSPRAPCRRTDVSRPARPWAHRAGSRRRIVEHGLAEQSQRRAEGVSDRAMLADLRGGPLQGVLHEPVCILRLAESGPVRIAVEKDS